MDGIGSETCPTANFGVCVVLNTWVSYIHLKRNNRFHALYLFLRLSEFHI